MARKHQVEVKPFPWGAFSDKGLESIIHSTARINIWHGAVRSSKTICSLVRWLDFIADPPEHGDLWMIGKTERTLKRNILDLLESMVGSDRFHHVQGAGEVYIDGRKIYIAGANDAKAESKIRGATIAGVYDDEITLNPGIDYFRMLLSRLSPEGATFFGTTNPDSPYHWLKTEFIDAQGLDMRAFHFELSDNPNLSAAYINALEKEFTGLWYKRFIKGLWVMAEGVIYDMFNEDVHVIEDYDDFPEEIKSKGFDRYLLGVDYGTSNPTVFLLIGQKGRDLYVIDEYYWDARATSKQKTDAEYSADLKKFVAGRFPQVICYDPSAASFGTQMRRDRIHGLRHADNSVIDGIRNVSTFLSQNRLHIVRKRCPNTIKEFFSYLWDAKAQERGEDKPIKTNDHCLDALRYVIQTLFARFLAA